MLINVDIKFDIEKLIWRGNIATKAILTMKKVELIDKYKFVQAALNKNFQTFLMDVVLLENNEVHPFRVTLIATFQKNKALTEIRSKYTNYANIFSPDLALELFN